MQDTSYKDNDVSPNTNDIDEVDEMDEIYEIPLLDHWIYILYAPILNALPTKQWISAIIGSLEYDKDLYLCHSMTSQSKWSTKIMKTHI